MENLKLEFSLNFTEKKMTWDWRKGSWKNNLTNKVFKKLAFKQQKHVILDQILAKMIKGEDKGEFSQNIIL